MHQRAFIYNIYLLIHFSTISRSSIITIADSIFWFFIIIMGVMAKIFEYMENTETPRKILMQNKPVLPRLQFRNFMRCLILIRQI
jgi:hypothetical protein